MSSSIVRGKYLVEKVIDSEKSQIIPDGALYQEDGEIVAVGSYSNIKAAYNPDREIGSDNHLIIPGLVNAHHHIGLTPFQLGIPDLALEPWITARYGMRNADPYLDTLYCAIQMIESGITTVMHNHGAGGTTNAADQVKLGKQVLKGYQESGMRAAFSFMFRDQNNLVYQEDDDFIASLPSELGARAKEQVTPNSPSSDEYFDVFTELHQSFSNDNRINIFLAPGNVQWCSDEFFQAAKEYATRYKTGIHIHLQESVYQKIYGLRTWNKTPLAHLEDLGILGPELSCAHGVWLNDSDIEILSRTRTIICHNASSNLRLKSGVAPLNRLVEMGVTVGIGIDEAGINDDNDMLQEMRLVQKIHRMPGVMTPSPTSHQILQMSTVNGAQATLFNSQVGTLEPGKRADIVLVNLTGITEPYLHPSNNIIDSLIYRGRASDVETVIVDGEVVMENKTMTKVNKNDVWEALKEHMSTPLTEKEKAKAQLGRDLLPYVNNFYAQWDIQAERPFYSYNDMK